MSKEKVGAAEQIAIGVAGGAGDVAGVAAPSYSADFECIGADGLPRWKVKWQNAVMQLGKIDLINNYFGRTGPAANNSWWLGLHSVATANATATSNSFAQITGSEVNGYATSRPLLTFASNVNNTSASASASYGFTSASTWTVNGAFVCGIGATGTNVSATAGTNGLLYSVGNFAATRQVLQNDTLNVTITVQFA